MSLKLKNFKVQSYFLFFWLLLLTLLFLNFRNLSFYQINDDFFLYGITSGVLYGIASADAIFISAPINHLLKILFESTTEINWYFELIFTNLYLALVVFSYFFYKQINFENKLQYLYFIVANLVPIFIFFEMFMLIQFSQVAIISTAVGVIVLLKSNEKLLNIFAALLVILGFSWRSEAAILATSMVLSVFIINLLISKKIGHIKDKRFIIVVSSIFIIFVIKSVNFLGFAPWQSEEKNKFRKLNYDIMRTYDFAPTREVIKLQQRAAKLIGWSKNDYNLYVKTYFANEQVYSVDNLDKLAKESSPTYTPKYFINSFFELTKILVKEHLVNLSAILAFIILVVLLKREKKYTSQILVLVLLFISFIFFVYLLGKIPNRIYWPLGFIYLISIASLIDAPNNFNKSGAKLPAAFAIFSLVAVTVFTLNINAEFKTLQWWKSVREENTKGFDRVLAFETDKPIVAFSSFYSPLIQTLDPATNKVDQIFKDMVYLNWATRSADYNTHLANLNMNSDLFSDIAQGKAYLATANLEELQMVNQYLIEHRQINPTWDKAPFVFSDTGLGIWKILSFEEIN